MPSSRLATAWVLALASFWLGQAMAYSQATIAYGRLSNPHPGAIRPPWDDSGYPVFSTWGGLVLDLNGDGHPDVGFADDDMSFYIYGFGSTRVLTYPPAGLDINSFLPVIVAGTRIGSAPPNPSLIWRETINVGPPGPYAATFNGANNEGYAGYWEAVEGYTGVEFYIGAELHYAWIRVGSPLTGTHGGYIYDYAYETRPNTPIMAGAKPVPVPLASPEVVRSSYLRLTWPSVIGKAYQIQAKARLDAFTWTNLSFAIPAAATNSMVDLPTTAAAQFFRVVEAD